MEPLTLSKNQLEGQLLEMLDMIEKTGRELIVTDNGKPVLKIVPYNKKGTVDEIFGDYYGKLVIHEDINTPTIDEWGEV